MERVHVESFITMSPKATAQERVVQLLLTEC